MVTSKAGDLLRRLEMEGESSMAEWRRLAGLPEERAESPDFGGPGLNEIAARQAAAHQREMLGCNGYSVGQLGRLRPDGEDVPPEPLRVGVRVQVQLPDWFPGGSHHVATGTVKEVHAASMIAMVKLDAPHSEEVQVLAARVDMLAPIPSQPMTSPQRSFQVGDRVRAVRDEVREKFVGITGMVTRECSPGGKKGFFVRPDNSDRQVQFFDTDLELIEARAVPERIFEADGYLRMDPVRVPDPDPGPQETYAATLELAGGRVLDIPGPDPEIWELVDEKCWDAEEDVRAMIRREGDVMLRYARPVEAPDWGGGVVILGHEAALCWAKDMARVINAESERGAIMRELRIYRRRKPVDPHADRPYPTLRAYLW